MAGFKIATGYVEVEVLYDKNRLQRTAATAGRNTGDAFSRGFSRQFRDTISNKFDWNLLTKSLNKSAAAAGRTTASGFNKGFSDRVNKGLNTAVDWKRIERETTRRMSRVGIKSGESLSRSLGQGVKETQKDFDRVMQKFGRDSSHKFTEGFSTDLEEGIGKAFRDLRKSAIRKTSRDIAKEVGYFGRLSAMQFTTDFEKTLAPRIAKSFNSIKTTSKAVSGEMGLFGRVAAIRFAEQFQSTVTPRLGAAFKDVQRRAKPIVDSFKELGHRAGLDFEGRFGNAISQRIPVIRDTLRRNLNPVVTDIRNLGEAAGTDFTTSFRDEIRRRFTPAFDRAKQIVRESSDEIAYRGRFAARWYTLHFKEAMTRGIPSALDSANRSVEKFVEKTKEQGRRAGNNIVSGVRESISGSRGVFGHIRVQAERDSNLLGTIGRNGGRLFTNGLGEVLESGGRASWAAFRAASRASVHLTMVGLVAIIAGIALAMPAIGAGIAGALTLGFAGGIGALGVLAWKESDKVKGAFKEMSDFIKEDFKRISAPMESVLVDLAGNVRDAYESISPSIESFFATTEPAFKSFQKNILDGFSLWGPAIERSGSAFSALERSMGPMMRSKIAELGTAFEELFAVVEKNPEAVTAVFRGIMNAIIGVVKVITWLTETWAAMRDAWNRDSGGMRTIIQGIGSALEGVIGGVIAVGRGVLTALWEMVSGIVTGFQMIFSGDILAGLHRVFEGLFRGIGAMFSGLIEGMVHLVSKLFQIFGVDTSKWVSNTMNFLYTTWNTVLDFFQGLPSTIGGWFSSLWDGIKNTFNGFISWVQGFGATIIHWITWPFREVYRIIVGNSIIPDLVRAVLGWIQNLVTWIMTPLNAIKNFFVTVFTAIFNTVSNIVRSLVSTVVNVFSGLGNGVRAVLSGLGSFFSSIWNGILNVTRSVWNAVAGAIRGAVNGVVNWVRSTLNSWVGWIYDKWNALSTNTRNIWNQLTSGIRSVVNAVVNWVRTTFNNWVGWIYDKFNALRTNSANIWNSFTRAIRSIVSAVVNWVRNTFNNWVGWIYDKFNAMRSNSINIWNSFTRALRSVVSAVVNWVRNTFNNWVGWIYDKFNAMRSNSINIWNSFTRAIRNIVNAVVRWVQNTFNNWVGWIYDKFNALRTNGSNIWNSFTRAIRNIVNAVVRWVQNTFNNWVGWIYDKFNALRTNGSNIWNSLTRSIRSIVSAVVNWVQNAFSRWVGWIYDKFNALRTNSINIWERIRKGIVDKVTAFRDRAMRVVNGFKDGVIEAFDKARKGVESAWDKVRKAASAPVKFMVNTVYEKGIRVLWSKIADHVPGLGYLKKVTLPRGFARGGVMPGYTPGKDVHTVKGPSGPVGLSGGEAIMRPEWTRAVGADAVHAMNKVARTKGVAGLRAAMAAGPGYHSGGIAGSAKSGNSRTKDLGTSRAMPMGPTNPLKTPTGKLARGWNTGHQGFAEGGILGWVKDKVDSVKDFASDVMGNIVGWATKPFTKAFDMLKDKANGGGTGKNFPGVPYHAGQHMWGKIKELFQTKDDEYNAQFDDSGGNFGSFTYNGKPADLPGLRGTKPHVRMIGNFIASMFKVGTAYGLGGPPEHSTGRAIDYMVGTGSGQDRGDGISAYYLKNKELALKWVIWRQRIFNVARNSWRKMEDRGNPTQNHFDHPHVFHQTSAPKAKDFISKQKGVKFSGGGGGGGSGGSGNTMMTSFWDSFQPMANGRRMHPSAVASSVIPLGTKVRVKVGGKTANGSIDDLGPNSFVYRRHHPKALLDLAEPMMQKLTGRRSNTVMGSFKVTKKGRGRTLFGYTRWNGVFDPKRGTNGFDTGGIIDQDPTRSPRVPTGIIASSGSTPMGRGSHDVGGLLPDKHVAYNRSGEAEMVTTLDQLKAIVAAQQHAGDTIIIEKICIDAKNVKEFNDIINVVKGVRKSGRSNGGNVGFELRD